MEENRFTYCPECGSRAIKTLFSGRKWQCPDCSLELYNNVAAAVGLLIQDGEGRILFEKRAKEPRKGYLAFPGGFCDPNESGEEAAVRECKEETGLEPSHIEYLCSFPNTYEYKSVVYKTCDLFFTATLPKGAELCAQAGEVDGFVWLYIKNEDDIKSAPLAFNSARKTLEVWLKKKGTR